MRTCLVILATLFFLSTKAQMDLRSYSDELSAAGPLMNRVTGLQNGDVLYYDQLWSTIARLDPGGDVVWYHRYDLTGQPTQTTGIAHVVETISGELVAALVVGDANGQYHPALMRLDADGNVLTSKILAGSTMGIADYARVASLIIGGEIRMVVRGTGDGGTLHAFDASGAPLWSKSYASNSDLPVEMTQSFGLLTGANVGKVVQYDATGATTWSFTPGPLTSGSDTYLATIWDVVPVPIGTAFAFLRVGGSPLMTPGIGLLSANGIFQGAIVFNVDEQQGAGIAYDAPHLTYSDGRLAMVTSTGNGPTTGYIFSCDANLASTQVTKVQYGDASWPRTITNAGNSAVMSGTIDMPGSGKHMVVRSTHGAADFTVCFPARSFTATAFPMPAGASTTITGTTVTTTWTDQAVIFTSPTFNTNFLCGVQGVPENTDADAISFFPDPATDHVQLTWPKLEQLSIRIVDMTGREVLRMASYTPATDLAVNALTEGSYVLHATGLASRDVRIVPFVIAR